MMGNDLTQISGTSFLRV